jgi:hypothetical protein
MPATYGDHGCTADQQHILLYNEESIAEIFVQALRFSFLYIFSNGSTAPRVRRPPHYRGFTITLRHTTLGRTPLDE